MSRFISNNSNLKYINDGRADTVWSDDVVPGDLDGDGDLDNRSYPRGFPLEFYLYF